MNPVAPTTSFSPGDLAGAEDPYALLAEVRASGAVLRSPGSWIVTGHAQASAILRHPQARSGFIGELYRGLLPDGAARDEMSHRINFLDPPDHTRVRTLVSKAFTPRRSEALEPFVRDIARRILSGIEGQEKVDLIAAFAHQVPSLVISELLGVPATDRDVLTVLSDRVSALLRVGSLGEREMAAAVAGAEEMHAYLRRLFAERRAAPRDDLVSALLAAEDGGARLSEAEMLSLAATLYSAGHRTTRDLFSNGLATLLADPAAMRALRDATLPSSAVAEEFLRYETPTHYVARMLEVAVELDAVTIPAGEPIAIILAAANRDPAVYPEAGRFLPERWMSSPAPPAPLSFAFGPHFCLGASLARMEVRVMLEAVVEVLPSMALCDEPLRWHHTGLFRGLDALPVRPKG